VKFRVMAEATATVS